MRVPTQREQLESEQRIREALHRAGIRLTLTEAAALICIAVDHFAGMPEPLILGMVHDLKRVADHALRTGALCPTCRAEYRGSDRVCEWCAPPS